VNMATPANPRLLTRVRVAYGTSWRNDIGDPSQ
jgi:hypothetical protein